MEVSVDRSLCEANAVCVGFAPEVFDLDDDENLVIGPVPDSEVERVSQAVQSCPKNALFTTG
ncbi:ferredoxin [Amycolatopsis echigonensis]|uniref:Ferredoxin n=1 Tax=Amycolatopsis echigonensis TaxID=2576905 RepID=A0A2N3W9W0_9PSEU|nr:MULTISPECIES: ferredoxin [Amycolatopsis]MBB2503231.1 ferredoxin [Amycolatopsis echigonensis]PKV90655.1 ferredoxin [Amycolatopsis niigatensis]